MSEPWDPPRACFALEQEKFWGLSGAHPKRLLALLLVDLGEIQKFRGNRELNQTQTFTQPTENTQTKKSVARVLTTYRTPAWVVDRTEIGDCPEDLSLSSTVTGLKIANMCQRKTKGQQLKGQNRFIIVHTFSHFLALFQNFSPKTFPFKTKGFCSRRTKEKKRK